jgi:pyruvate dehydrogenase E1 component alpha subunit
VMQGITDADNILSTYREHGHALACGIDPGIVMAEMYGKVEGCCRGRGGSMHLFYKKKNFFGGNAIVAGHLAMAVGMALAAKKQHKNNVTYCFFGEGAAAEGEFHEAMNLAALWAVPVLFVCENNLYAMGTAVRYSHSIVDIEKKGPAYGIATDVVDGMDVLKVTAAAKKAIKKIATTGGPYLLVCNTYRFRAHSMFDAELYRDKAEVEEWKKRDPVLSLQKELLNQNSITQQEIVDLESKVEAVIQSAVDFAEAGNWEPEGELTKFVYSESNN